MKKAIYTVNLSGYDHFPRAARENPEWDKIVFTDMKVGPGVRSKWDRVVYIPPTGRPDVKARELKWMSHLLLPEYDLVCYYDANMEIKKPLESRPFRIKHQKRSSVREEADALIRLNHRWTRRAVEDQVAYYREQGFPDDQGLFLNGFFCRSHSEEENRVCEMVYDHVQNFTSRDQLALPYAMWANDYRPERVVNRRFFHENIKFFLHKKKHKILGK